MSYVLIAYSTSDTDWARDVHGEFVASYDPDAFGGRGEAAFTKEADKALKFETMQAAIEFYRQQSKIRPSRPDGKANRPLTAFTMLLERLP